MSYYFGLRTGNNLSLEHILHTPSLAIISNSVYVIIYHLIHFLQAYDLQKVDAVYKKEICV